MNRPMIEQSESGITLSKSLAWTILASVVAGGVWIGTQVTEVGNQVTEAKNGVETLAGRQSEDRSSIIENRDAISRLRASNARIDQRLISIEQSSRRTETSVEEILRFLRGISPEESK